GELGHGGRIERIEVDERRVLPDPGVAGGREQLMAAVLRAEGEDDGVLARARAEDQDSHAASLSAGVARDDAWGRRRPSRDYRGDVPRKISTDVGRAALAAVRADDPASGDLATAVRYLLQLLAEKAPGNSVEVRVPPF